MVQGLDDETASRIGEALGASVATAQPLSGGDINQAYEVELADGRRVFIKLNPRAPAGLFAAEARGLKWLADARALAVPEVLAVSESGPGSPFLALALVEAGRRRRDFSEALGRGLAALHRSGAPGFGLDHDNFIASLPQGNAAVAGGWVEFLRERRLRPLLERAARHQLLPGGLQRDFDRLFAVLADRVGPEEPPARLHGDLWAGNLIVDAQGAPTLIDPAVYGGHREIDLAMMRLFGGFDATTFSAYHEAYPVAPGAADRVALYQLVPLLVHVCLFGGGYVGQVRASLARLL